jgi:hypothetical protein
MEAIDYAKNVLAPYALDAFPEAYALFKSLLSLLIYVKKDNGKTWLSEQTPPLIVQEFSVEARNQLAESLATTLIYVEGHKESIFSLLIK